VEVGPAVLEDSCWPPSPLAVRRHSSWSTGKWCGVPSKDICQNILIVGWTRFVVTSDNYVFCFTDRNKVSLKLHCVVPMVFMVKKYLKIDILGRFNMSSITVVLKVYIFSNASLYYDNIV